MDSRASLEQMLQTAKLVLAVLEQQAAGYTGLTIPAHLQVQLEEKRQEVGSLEARLAQLGQGGGKVAGVPDNLPRYVDVFVGRKEEIAKCLAALEPDDRGWGVTIDGLGGMGKTALALEVAYRAKAAGQFDAYLFASAKTSWLSPEGVREETLALSSLDAFTREFGRVLGCGEIAQMGDAIARRVALLEALRGRKALLIWDNLETLTAEEREAIAEFMRKLPAPNKAIVTSRRRTGESALTLRLDRLSEAEAVELIAAKAARNPGLARLRNAEADHALYVATGGNPLAIDWALGLAAKQGQPVATVAARLAQGEQTEALYGFLFAGLTAELSADDRLLLAVLATFRAGATEAALAEATGLGANPLALALEKLLGWSLVNELDNDRWGLHPLTRVFARQAGGPLPPETYRSALRHWLDYAQRFGGGGKDAYKTHDRLEAEWPNLEAAAAALRDLCGLPGPPQDRAAAQMLIDLHQALSEFLWFRGYWDEKVKLAQWCYEAAQSLEQWRDAGWGAYRVGFTHYCRRESDRAATWADRAAAAWERGGTRPEVAVGLRLRGLVARQRGDLAEADRLSQEALAIHRDLGEETHEAIVLNDLGSVAKEQKQFDHAETYFQQGLAIARRLGNLGAQATYSGNLGRLALDRDRPAAARPWFEQQLTLARQVGREDLIASAQAGLAQVLEAEGRPAEALATAREARAIRERLRDGALPWTRELVDRLSRAAAG